MSKKGKKGKHEALTPAHAVAEAEMAESGQPDGEAARKAIEAEPGPGRFTDPVAPPAAGQFDRPYLGTGHAAPSPQSGPPDTAPAPPPLQPGMPAAGEFDRPYLAGRAAPGPQHQGPNVAPAPPGQPGVLQPLPMSAVPAVVGTGPVVQAMAQHQARAAQSMPPPPPARGQ
jgi:hypothetical protein